MARKKALTVDPTMAIEKTSKSRLECTHYKEIHIEKMIDDMHKWYNDYPEAIAMHEFYNAYFIPRRTYHDLLERFPQLKEAHIETLEKLGGRMLSRSINFKANWNPVKFILHQYSPEYAAAKEFDAMLAAKARESTESSNGPQIVVIEKFSNSDIVPEKK